MRKWNFCAGPAVISEEVLSEVKDELLEWGDSGMSIMEMSHRSKIYDGVATDAKQDFIDILEVPDSHDVLFLQGGATHQFQWFLSTSRHLILKQIMFYLAHGQRKLFQKHLY